MGGVAATYSERISMGLSLVSHGNLNEKKSHTVSLTAIFIHLYMSKHHNRLRH